MAESNKMREMPINKLMVQMGIPMILSMALQAVYNIVDSAFVGNMMDICPKARIQGFPIDSENWFDVGKPETLAKAEAYYASL